MVEEDSSTVLQDSSNWSILLVRLREGLKALSSGPWIVVIRTVVSIFLVGFMVWRVSPERILSLWQDVEPAALVSAFFLLLIGQVLNGCKWWLLLKTYEPGVDWKWAMRTYFMGMFFNTILPWSYGGDGVRSYVATKDTGLPLSRSITTVVIDRLSGYAALLLWGVLGLASLYWPLSATVALALIGTAGIILIAILLPRSDPLIKVLPRPISRLLTEKTIAVSLRQAMALSLVIHVFGIMALGLIMRGSGLHFSWGFVAVGWLVLSSASLAPLALGGIGVKEFSLAALLTAHGAPSEEATVVALTYGLTFAILGLFGGLVLLPLGEVGKMRGLLQSKRKAEKAL